MKKRTWIQPQVNKADELSRECKDSLVSTLPFTKQRIVTILGLDYKKIKYIPNQEHPCDHFVVTANIIVRAWLDSLLKLYIYSLITTKIIGINYLWSVKLLFFGPNVLSLFICQSHRFAFSKLKNLLYFTLQIFNSFFKVFGFTLNKNAFTFLEAIDFTSRTDS